MSTGPDRELYRKLEVLPDASAREIVSAYRRLAHGVHPDAHPDDPEAAQRFRDITDAYDVLSDPERRARYDRATVQPPTRTVPAAEPSLPASVFIGPRPVSAPAPPLRAGPVRVEESGAPRPRPSPVPHEDWEYWADDLTWFFDRLLAAGWFR